MPLLYPCPFWFWLLLIFLSWHKICNFACLNYDSYRLDIIGDYRHSTYNRLDARARASGRHCCRYYSRHNSMPCLRSWDCDYFVSRGTDHASIARACVYAVLFVIVFLSCNLLARLLSSILKAVKLGMLDRAGGAVMRTFLWLLFTSLAINIYLGICPSDKARFNRADKPWRNITVQIAPKLLGYLANWPNAFFVISIA